MKNKNLKFIALLLWGVAAWLWAILSLFEGRKYPFIGLFIIGGLLIFGAFDYKKTAAEKEQAAIKAQEEAAARAEAWAKQEEAARLAREDRIRQREQERKAQEDRVAQLIAALPRAEISTEGIKGTIKDQAEIADLKYNNITVKTPAYSLEDFVVVDLETTGTKKRDAVVSVAALIFEAGEPVRAFYTLINPGRPIPPEASAVNGIHDADVEGSPTIWQVMPSLQSFIGDLPIVGHNLPFDLGYLYRYGFDIGKNKRFDTLRLARRVLDLEHYTLSDCCHDYGIPVVNAHQSLFDCYMTGQLFTKLANDLINK